MKAAGKILVLATATTVLAPARAGHELPIYPSYYPQEIRVEAVEPAAAAAALANNRIQAYIGPLAELPVAPGKSIESVRSLGSYLVVRVNPASPRAKDGAARCAVVQGVVSALAGQKEKDFFLHPYPVNPLHADYFQHFDLASGAKARFTGPLPAASNDLKVRAEGVLAKRLAAPRWTQAQEQWDASLEEVPLDDLIAAHRYEIDGPAGPPWLKEGWFHAWLLLGAALPGAEAKSRAQALLERRQQGDYRTEEERTNLERELVKLLTADCWAGVAGYALRHWHYNAAYSGGIENIAYDSHSGFRSAIFLRTVKLKDFPWNGWLTLGVPKPPAAAWNPLGGFSDDTGRLIWLTLGDPPLFPEPYGSLWNLNRIGDVRNAAR